MQRVLLFPTALVFLTGCCCKPAARSADFSTPSASVSTYFRALKNVDIESVISCLADPDSRDTCAAIDAMYEACPFFVLSYGSYSQPVDANTRAYFDEIVANTGMPFVPGIVAYDGDHASVLLQSADGTRKTILPLRKIENTWKIDPHAAFASHYPPGAVELDCGRAKGRLNRLKILKHQIDAGRFKRIEDAGEAVKALGFDIA